MATLKRGTLGHRRGQVPLEARREELLTTAARLFATQGYDATRLDDIADALGVTRAALYYYFPGGKSEILEVVCETATSAAEAVIADALALPTTIEQLRGYAVRLPQVNTTDEARVFYREVSQLEPAFRAGLSRRVQKLNAAIEGLVEAAIAEGTFRDDIDPRIATQALVGMVQWIPQWFRASKKNASAQEVGEMFADIFLDGMQR